MSKKRSTTVSTPIPHSPTSEQPSEARRSDRLVDRVFTAAADAIVLTDPEGRIVQVNRAAEELFGHAHEDLLGQPIETLVPVRFRHAHQSHVAAFFRAPRARRMGEGIGLFGLHRDGREFPIDVALSIIDSPSQPLVMAAVRDVSEQHRVEVELQRRTHELETADRQKDLFVATLAHELRSPLAALQNVASLLRLPSVDESTTARAADLVERQAAHMSRLVEDLVEAARLRSGGAMVRREPTDLVEIVGRACELARTLIESHRHAFTVTVPSDPVVVDGDATRLVQVVTNLLTNAARYTEDEGSIALSLAVEQDDAILKVRDNGIGLRPEMLGKVFELFTQAAETSAAAAGGLGLGLALVRSMVEWHGGTVSAHSEGLGQGSEFVVRLPLHSARGGG